MKRISRLKKNRAFTLVELVVVIGVIGVLAGILIPVMIGAVHSARVSSVCGTASDVRNCINNFIVTKDAAGKFINKAPHSSGDTYVTVVADHGVYENPVFTGDFWANGRDENTVEELRKYLETYLGYHRMYAVGYLHNGTIVGLYFVEDAANPPEEGAPGLADFSRTDFWPRSDGVTETGIIIGTSPQIKNA